MELSQVTAGRDVRVEDNSEHVGPGSTLIAPRGGGVVYLQQPPEPVEPVVGQLVRGTIPAPPPGFQPRPELFAALSVAAESSPVAVLCALTGQRGVGKTQLAAAYARRRITERWPIVAWINAEHPDTILAGLDDLATAIGLRREGEDVATGIDRLRSWWPVRSEPALLVFDNLTDVDAVVGHLPAGGPTQVVITTTRAEVENLGRTVAVEVFTPVEAIEFLKLQTGLDDEAGAAELAQELGWLPLALTQAAAVIRARRLACYAACLRLVGQFPLERYLTHRPGQPYPRGVAETILLSLSEVGLDTDPQLAQLAGVLALLSPEGVVRELLSPLTGGDIQALDDRVERLAGGAVIAYSIDGVAVTMHRLVARVVRERHRANGQYVDLIAAAVAVLEAAVFPETQAWDRRHDGDQLIGHIDALYQHSDSGSDIPQTPSVVERLQGLRAWSVRQLTASASLARAIPLAHTVLSDSRRLLGAEHPDTLGSANNLAGAYESAGRLEQAIPLFEQTLQERRRLLGAEHPDTLASANNLAGAYRSAGRLEQAIPLYEQTLQERRRLLGAEHPDTLASANNLAGAYESAGRLEQAIPLYEQTLTDCRRLLGAEHPDTLT
ncbi:MAG: tetratricopeptide repeat protein, partial [Pseudonocardiaceae bacterium]